MCAGNGYGGPTFRSVGCSAISRTFEHFELPERLGEIARRTVRFGRPQLVRECGDNCLVLLARDGKHGAVTRPYRQLESVTIRDTRRPRHLKPRPVQPRRYRAATI